MDAAKIIIDLWKAKPEIWVKKTATRYHISIDEIE